MYCHRKEALSQIKTEDSGNFDDSLKSVYTTLYFKIKVLFATV
jgi:hypothetical protein